MMVRVVRSVPRVRVSVFSNDDFRTSFMMNKMRKTDQIKVSRMSVCVVYVCFCLSVYFTVLLHCYQKW